MFSVDKPWVIILVLAEICKQFMSEELFHFVDNRVNCQQRVKCANSDNILKNRLQTHRQR